MTKGNSEDKIFIIGMILSMTCWGFSWTSGKILSNYGDPLTISFLRFLVTFLSLVVILYFMKERMSISRNGYVDLFVAAALISLYTFLFFKGLTLGKPGAGGVLVTVLNPIITYAMSLVWAGRKPTRNEFFGLTLGLIAGVVLLKLITEAGEIFKAGNIFFLLASFTWAILSRFTARATRYGSSLSFSFWMYGISTLLMFLLSGWSASSETLSKSDFTFWGNLFFSATITTSLATTFYFVATSKVGASKASSFIFMVPFSAALGSWIFLGEIIQMHTMIGGILGIAAVYILNKKEAS
ncbi:DMT family transporter [Chryseolinea sp. H1M3-3]|uniref:DMT family transporter n=1 Tax=Chryseolinea sp. H1M3-3 TaxID=3034144 RepID=UPI0023EA8ACF|nr:DMT family transporter [Chryseolinea sp. H1M3-3]